MKKGLYILFYFIAAQPSCASGSFVTSRGRPWGTQPSGSPMPYPQICRWRKCCANGSQRTLALPLAWRAGDCRTVSARMIASPWCPSALGCSSAGSWRTWRDGRQDRGCSSGSRALTRASWEGFTAASLPGSCPACSSWGDSLYWFRLLNFRSRALSRRGIAGLNHWALHTALSSCDVMAYLWSACFTLRKVGRLLRASLASAAIASSESTLRQTIVSGHATAIAWQGCWGSKEAIVSAYWSDSIVFQRCKILQPTARAPIELNDAASASLGSHYPLGAPATVYPTRSFAG